MLIYKHSIVIVNLLFNALYIVATPMHSQNIHNQHHNHQYMTQSSMPNEWQPAIAPNGQQYFFNYITKQTSWALPIEENNNNNNTHLTSHKQALSSSILSQNNNNNSILGSVSLSLFDKKQQKQQQISGNSPQDDLFYLRSSSECGSEVPSGMVVVAAASAAGNTGKYIYIHMFHRI